VVPWCPRCGTALSSHELAQGYKEVIDNSVYVKFRLKPGQKIGILRRNEKTYICHGRPPLDVTGNVALAVGKKLSIKVHIVKSVTDMAKFFTPGEYFISAKGLATI